MRFLEFKEQLNSFLIFSLQDIKKVDTSFHRRRLTEWQKKEYIKKVIRGYYVFSDAEMNESLLAIIANKICAPSYISLEMAMSHYGLIPESVYGVTSVTSRKTRYYSTPYGEFSYRKIKPALMFGYVLVSYRNQHYKIADFEKTLLDYLYLNPQIKRRDDFEGLRLNKNTLRDQLNTSRLETYLRLFNHRALANRSRALLNYLNHD